MAGEPVSISRYLLVSGSMQEELMKDPFRAKGFRVEIDLLFRFAVRLTNVLFGIQFGTDTHPTRMRFGQRTNRGTST